MALESSAARLGIGHSYLSLAPGKTSKLWVCPKTREEMSVEEACLGHYMANGWRGYAWEGGLILNLIKAMALDPLIEFHRAHFIEGIFLGAPELPQIHVPQDKLLATIKRADVGLIRRNFDDMSIGPISALTFHPHLTLEALLDLYGILVNERVHQIASVFAKAPYDYRSGWPDVTLWKPATSLQEGAIAFKEVKAPEDKIRTTQRRIITDILLPLGFDVELVEVTGHVR